MLSGRCTGVSVSRGDEYEGRDSSQAGKVVDTRDFGALVRVARDGSSGGQAKLSRPGGRERAASRAHPSLDGLAEPARTPGAFARGAEPQRPESSGPPASRASTPREIFFMSKTRVQLDFDDEAYGQLQRLKERSGSRT